MDASCWNFGFVSVALIDSEVADWICTVIRRVLFFDAESLARLVTAYTGFHGIRNFGEAREAERAMVSGVDK